MGAGNSLIPLREGDEVHYATARVAARGARVVCGRDCFVAFWSPSDVQNAPRNDSFKIGGAGGWKSGEDARPTPSYAAEAFWMRGGIS